MSLKAQLHIHAKGDPKDLFITYTPYDVVDKAVETKTDVIAFTFHDKYFNNKKVIEYARKKGVLVIPAIEKTIEGKDILIYNPPKKIESINTFKELKSIKNDHMLIMAPHPFFVAPYCLKHKIIEHYDLFDAWEYCFFYTKFCNCNKKLVTLNKKHGTKKAIIGTSDVHNLDFFDKTYAVINAQKSIPAIFKAIRQNNVATITSPLSCKEFLGILRTVIYPESTPTTKRIPPGSTSHAK
ncbi:MAG: PHP domain-containing protein [Candidatus Woesearchaeota archaeon]